MLGVIAALAAEFSSGESVLKQITEEPTGIIAAFAIFIAASFAPLLAGVQPAAESVGPFTAKVRLSPASVAPRPLWAWSQLSRCVHGLGMATADAVLCYQPLPPHSASPPTGIDPSPPHPTPSSPTRRLR